MYKLLLTIFFFCLYSPTFAQDFTIDRVFVESEYNSRYVLTYANRLIPLEEKINPKTIECLIESLNESGMFQKIEMELIPTDKNKEFTLNLKPIYKGNPKEYSVQEIVIKDSLGINKKSFLDQLQSKELILGKSFMPYNAIEFSIGEAVEEIEELSEKKSISRQVWVKAYLIMENFVKLEISGEPPNCSKCCEKKL